MLKMEVDPKGLQLEIPGAPKEILPVPCKLFNTQRAIGDILVQDWSRAFQAVSALPTVGDVVIKGDAGGAGQVICATPQAEYIFHIPTPVSDGRGRSDAHLVWAKDALFGVSAALGPDGVDVDSEAA